ncbi:hypothetical protein [Streptomyces afghaniensis]|uniref:hypothetical protein n=1 Tax=Streptomyces afghaniensis TaxID=66865 RepID=UPI0037935C73
MLVVGDRRGRQVAQLLARIGIVDVALDDQAEARRELPRPQARLRQGWESGRRGVAWR